MRLRCATCEEDRGLEDMQVKGFVFVAVPECSYLELRCPPEKCTGGVRMFASPPDIHARAEVLGFEVTYEGVPPVDLIGTYYLQMRRAGRVDVTRPAP